MIQHVEIFPLLKPWLLGHHLETEKTINKWTIFKRLMAVGRLGRIKWCLFWFHKFCTGLIQSPHHWAKERNEQISSTTCMHNISLLWIGFLFFFFFEEKRRQPRNRNCRKIRQSQHTMTFQIPPHYVHLAGNAIDNISSKFWKQYSLKQIKVRYIQDLLRKHWKYCKLCKNQ